MKHSSKQYMYLFFVTLSACSVLYITIQSDDVDLLAQASEMISKDVSLVSDNLFDVISKNDLVQLEKLLKSNVDVNAVDPYEGEYVALEWAAFFGTADALKQMLNHKGLDVKRVSPQFVHEVVQTNKLETIEELLKDKRFDVNTKGYHPNQDLVYRGQTPLHWVADQFFVEDEKTDITAQQIALIKLLLKYGANKNIKDDNGKTPYDIASHERLKTENQVLNLLKP